MPPDQVQPVNNKSKKYIWLAVIAVVLIAAAVAYLFTPMGSYIGGYFAQGPIPQELKGAILFADRTPNKTTTYLFGKDLKNPAEELDSVIVSETVDSTGSSRITRSADGTFKVFLEGKLISHDFLPRIGISRSPDGNLIAFAQATATPEFISPAQAPLSPIDSKRWEIIVYKASTNTIINLGVGVSPFFVDQTHVAWIAPAGLAIADLSSKNITVLVKNLNIHPLSVSLVSPDHSSIAWYDAHLKVLTAYKITATTATLLPLTTLANGSSTASSLHSLSLGNDGVYLIRLVG
jgi:hypothetical protein